MNNSDDKQKIYIENLRSLIQGEADDTPKTIDYYSNDASIFKVVPQVVVYPKGVSDLKQLVNFANQNEGVSLTARSAGTDMGGGPLNNSVIIDFTRYFNHVINVNDQTAVSEPGVFYRDFEKATLEKGLIMPSYPASRELCTIGGMVANNSGGEKTLTYGKTEKYVKRLKMVLADGNEYVFKALSMAELGEKEQQSDFEGEIYRKVHQLIENNFDLLMRAKPKVSKNSAGYYLWNVLDKEKGIFDLTKLFVGSQGTLGLITELELDLIKPKRYSHLLIVFLKDLNQLGETATHILNFKPESFESYDDHTFKVALKFLPQLMKQMGGNFITLGLEFAPEMLAVLEGGVPKLVLMAEFTGDSDEEALNKAKEAQDSLKTFHEKTRVTKSEIDEHKYWVIRRESFNMLRQNVHGTHTAPFIDDFVVSPERLQEFLPKLYEILNQYDLTYTIAGHIGDGNFHIIPLMDFKKPEAKKVIRELSPKIYQLIVDFKGSITGEHNDGLIRTPFLKMMYGEEVCKLFEETKKIFDPKNIFNPGKKVGGDFEYSMDHMITE